MTPPQLSKKEFEIIFVLGGPGAGKGTQCNIITANHDDFIHLSAGDLLREERSRPDSHYGEIINHHIREGTIVPMQITIKLLHIAMCAHPKHKKFLIDGFPRNIEQGIAFEEQICPARAVFFFDCSEETLVNRLLIRAQSSGRDDDNIESIRKRLVTYTQTTMPVIEHYAEQGKVYTIDCSDTVEHVTAKVNEILKLIE